MAATLRLGAWKAWRRAGSSPSTIVSARMPMACRPLTKYVQVGSGDGTKSPVAFRLSPQYSVMEVVTLRLMNGNSSNE